MRTVHGSPYIFSVKPKWWTVVFCFFTSHSSAEAHLRTSPPRGHSTVVASKHCEGFVAIWLRAREDIAHNRFQLSSKQAVWQFGLGKPQNMPCFCSLFVHNGPPICLCVPESASISSWALNHLSQHVLIMTTLATCDDNLSTFSQLVLIMLYIATDSCLLSLFSCRMHGCNYAIGYIIKHHQCNFCYHMHKYFMLVPTMAF